MRSWLQNNHIEMNSTHNEGKSVVTERLLGAVACTCNPATLETELWKGVGSIPVGGNSPSIGGWIV